MKIVTVDRFIRNPFLLIYTKYIVLSCLSKHYRFSILKILN